MAPRAPRTTPNPKHLPSRGADFERAHCPAVPSEHVRDQRRGFTIVELLVVIVVIAILANITIVAYNGITARAREDKMLSAVDAWEKAIRLYEAETGGWPIADGDYGGSYCLGSAEDFPAGDGFEAGDCLALNDGSGTYSNMGYTYKASFNQKLSNVVSHLPDTTFPRIDIPAGGTVTLRARAAIYFISQDRQIVQITYYKDSGENCGRGTGGFITINGKVFGQCLIELRKPE